MAGELFVHSCMLEGFQSPDERAPNSLLKGPNYLHVEGLPMRSMLSSKCTLAAQKECKTCRLVQDETTEATKSDSNSVCA